MNANKEVIDFLIYTGFKLINDSDTIYQLTIDGEQYTCHTHEEQWKTITVDTLIEFLFEESLIVNSPFATIYPVFVQNKRNLVITELLKDL